MANDKTIKLKGRIFFRFNIKTLSGLHIGGTEEGINIGGVDKTVIRNKWDNRPYIPGSSLRGKIRSLLEKYEGAPQNKSIGTNVKIHVSEDQATYEKFLVCQVFGLPGEAKVVGPSRLIVRDTQMSEESAKYLNSSGVRTDLPYTEVKTEVSIDRVTSAASPRQMERVPAGTIFSDAEIVYTLFEGDEIKTDNEMERLRYLIRGLELLEDDYLGGLGSRGSGKVQLTQIRLQVKMAQAGYEPKNLHPGEGYDNLAALTQDFERIKGEINRLTAQG
jgi:CRISPR-associated protein Csm3